MNMLYFVLALLVGLAGGFFVGQARGRQQRATLDDQLQREARAEAERIRTQADAEARQLREQAEQRLQDAARRLQEADDRERQVTLQLEAQREQLQAVRAQIEAERARAAQDAARERETLSADRQETRREREELKREIERLNRRAEQLDARGDKLDALEERLEGQLHALAQQEAELAERSRQVDLKLYEVAGLTPEAAREQILRQLDAELEEEKAIRVKAMTERATAEARRTARNVIAQAIQRSASETSSQMSVSVVPIPNDAMKGRLIGREGRNIRAFEALTGVDLIIDDTPEAVILSSFNPVRREVARHVLEALVADGRIHPTRIEEMVHKAQDEMKSFIHAQGEEAAIESGVVGLKPGLVQLLGRMYFRSSYGQNVLKHSVQVAHLTGIMADELGLDAALARRAGLMHDIGKSIDREIEGTHVEIGINLAKRFGEPPEVIDAIAHHHDPENGETLYSVLVAAADAISAARPGARREELEAYVRRLEQLEQIAIAFPGVQQAYAIQAGREVRVLVQPEKVTDAQATLLAREIAGRIEQDMEYPGQVQVTVVRESRAVEVAR
ncbi:MULTISPECIES: ribonuclease Y [Deinococcus]|uniref:Ribonuclease Y n=1 Tax=Deinococcus geothermalis (strain DSM 11300 / CIP 105573 / AG-3a) TaxID=319795 RepID=RNY_DEIGD|nr:MULTISPECIES: ribonuclease Y [Deinococcus]Q1J219.1 RecName: Full=Ribonuclease Y; Short=RNase Y [Deinococcus geothermalis DSM 11300]ABF44465.1 metal dependent phosphohydrolase [Deinococcus geothermalis DSM 11300]MBI0446453.1 ribonuclease Y [Deinococcus sp. DB0503]TDE84909.1 ribonuclease Y [Deinococcus sp. S9]